jgi:pilus assembly protein Flp/PilA
MCARFVLKEPVMPRRTSKRLEDSAFSLGAMAALVRDDRGASMVEYIILVGVVAILAMAGFKQFGFQLRAKIDEQATTVESVQSQ